MDQAPVGHERVFSMKRCTSCNSVRIVKVSGKCSDMFSCSTRAQNIYRRYSGCVPSDLNIGGGDYLEFEFCLECGKIQADFPLPDTKLEEITE